MGHKHITGIEAEAFAEEYEWFKSFRMSDETIARRFGLTLDGLAKRLERHGIASQPKPDIRIALDRLVAGGEDFTAADLPMALPAYSVAGTLASMVRHGRLVVVGRVKLFDATAGYRRWFQIYRVPAESVAS